MSTSSPSDSLILEAVADNNEILHIASNADYTNLVKESLSRLRDHDLAKLKGWIMLFAKHALIVDLSTMTDLVQANDSALEKIIELSTEEKAAERQFERVVRERNLWDRLWRGDEKNIFRANGQRQQVSQAKSIIFESAVDLVRAMQKHSDESFRVRMRFFLILNHIASEEGYRRGRLSGLRQALTLRLPGRRLSVVQAAENLVPEVIAAMRVP